MAIDRSSARRLGVTVDQGEAYEALLALTVVRGEVPVEKFADGARLAKRYRALPATLRRLVAAVDAGSGFNWSDLTGLVGAARQPRGLAELVEVLAGMDPLELKLALLGHHDREFRRQVGEELFREAAGGDLTAVRAFKAQAAALDRPPTGPLLGVPPELAAEMTLEVLRSLPADFYLADPGGPATLSAAAERAATSSRRLDTPGLVELLTRGLVYREEPGIDELRLIPTLVFRPWTFILDHERAKIFCFPVEPEPPAGEPAPQLVGLYRALGDPTRLRILKRLAAGRATFGQLARDLGLAKSTVHHHALALRTAGLVRHHLGRDGGLELNRQLPELDRQLSDFLKG